MSRKKRAQQRSRISKRINEQERIKNRVLFRDLIEIIFPLGVLFAKEQFHGNATWEGEQLVTQALLCALQESKNVTDSFAQTLETCQSLGLKRIARTYTGMMNVLINNQEVLQIGIRARLHFLAEQWGGRFFRTDGWVLMGFDGSRATVPRSQSNEKAFCAPNYGKGKKARYNENVSKRPAKKTEIKPRKRARKPAPPEPQIWITMVWHMTMRLPWTWRLGPSNSSERHHVREIIEQEQFPHCTLFTGDAGFVGFEFWQSIINAGHDFLVRVGGNVKLLSQNVNFKEQDDGTVLCWPKDQMDAGVPPLRLRLVRVTVGKTKMWMLTRVLDENELTIKQIAKFYKQRWLIEVEFRGLKQTVDKQKLRCRNPERSLVELEWALNAMAFAELVALRAQIAAAEKNNKKDNKREYTPNDRSLANTLRVLRTYLRNLHESSLPGQLTQDLINAVVQRYNNTTDKRARHRPKNPDKKPLGDPTVIKLTPQERRKLNEIELENAA
jgi:hypothetical protein